MDEPSPSLRRFRAECLRVGVSEDEIQYILQRRLEAYFEEHPNVRSTVERDYPNIDRDSVAHVFSPEIALEVLGTLPDGAGTRAYLDRLEALQKERGWSAL